MKDIDCITCYLAFLLKYIIFLSPYVTQEAMLLTTGRELYFQPHNFVKLFANVLWNYGLKKHQMVKWNFRTQLVNYAFGKHTTGWQRSHIFEEMK